MKNVLEYLERTAPRVPDKVAYADGTESLTFSEVYRAAKGIGTFLAKKGIKKEPVLVFMKRRPAAIAAFFGCVYSGNMYAPVDAEMPGARIRMICDNCRPKYLICDEETMPLASEYDLPGEPILYREIAVCEIDESLLSDVRRHQIDTDPVYLVYTSGSTGIPKGVCACHRSVIDYIENLSETLQVDEGTVFGGQAPLYFDACLKEIYPTVKYGATAYLIPSKLFMFPLKLIEYCNIYKVNTICWVASALNLVAALGTFETVKPMYLRTVAFGSEVMPPKQLRLWQDVLPEARFINLYGPTEATGMSCFYIVDHRFNDDEVVPIGRPFPNTDIILLDEEGKEARQGEICIRGTALTMGYYNDPERTAKAFTQNPLNPHYPELIYRTGDLAYLGDDGFLRYIGRRDFQIKHMGRRIELGEIEANVDMLDGIHGCCCSYDQIRKKIVLTYAGTLEQNQLRAILVERLPRYMLPTVYRHIEALPKTPNGKIDRREILRGYEEERT